VQLRRRFATEANSEITPTVVGVDCIGDGSLADFNCSKCLRYNDDDVTPRGTTECNGDQ
jgi:hypothetical protein